MYVHARAVEGSATTVFMIWQLARLRAWLLFRLKGVVALCFVYSQVQRSKTPRSALRVYLCVLCGSENKQRLFPYTALSDWFV